MYILTVCTVSANSTFPTLMFLQTNRCDQFNRIQNLQPINLSLHEHMRPWLAIGCKSKTYKALKHRHIVSLSEIRALNWHNSCLKVVANFQGQLRDFFAATR